MNTPTPQQQDFVTAVTDTEDSITLEALAGTGKTSSIVMAANALPPNKPALALAFNKNAALELSEKLPQNVKCCTLNSLGHRALANYLPKKLNLEFGKMTRLLNDTLAHMGWGQVEKEVWIGLKNLLEQARLVGYVPERAKSLRGRSLVEGSPWAELATIHTELNCDPPMEELLDTVLYLSCKEAIQSSIIDFTDQLYIPICWRIRPTQYHVVFIDEAQDLNPLQHKLVASAIIRKGRLIAVGDPNQAIYAWRGAKGNSLEQLSSAFSTVRLPLSTCFRCGVDIVTEAQRYVPSIEPFAGAIKGSVANRGKLRISDINAGDAIICRNNAPLIRVAYRLLREGRAINYLGRDISASLRALLTKIAGRSKKKPVADLLLALAQWTAAQMAEARAKRQYTRVTAIEDKSGALQVLLEAAGLESNRADVDRIMQEIFTPSSGLEPVYLSTIHGAKGLEWPQVWFINTFLIPNKFLAEEQEALREALKDNPEHDEYIIRLERVDELMAQETNLNYVGITRAQRSLNYATVK